jgi:4-hydroxybenzoate polyprenyltransferase
MPYIRIMRVDHWFKNVFVLPGIVVALSSQESAEWSSLFQSFIIGLGLYALVSLPLVLSLAELWIAGCAYNIPPVRTKDVPSRRRYC